MAITYAQALALVGADVPAHLQAAAEVPVLVGPQAQGDLVVVPVAEDEDEEDDEDYGPLPAQGLQLVRGEAPGNTHWLHAGFASPGVEWADAAAHPGWDGVVLGRLRVPPGQSALLVHTDEHGANGIGPGSYAIHRKRDTRGLLTD